MHKMKAFVRFRTLAEADNERGAPLHVAWFEPEHHVVEVTAPFLARRFGANRWALLTPERSVEWDGSALWFGPGARRDDAPQAEGGDELWLACYRSVFNPARLKVKAIEREMPKRDRSNLPQAQDSDALARTADERGSTMGHTSRSGPGPINNALSLKRAQYIRQRLVVEAPELAGRSRAEGMGFRQNIVGSGTDDGFDVLDRRVEFRIIPCG